METGWFSRAKPLKSSRPSREADVGYVVRLEPARLDPQHELGIVIAASEGAGAVVSFVGLARAEGGQVERLVLEHHPALTEQSLRAIAAEAGERFDVTNVHVVHRCGIVEAGEPIVFAAAASAHRRAAFEAADFLMDRLKTDAVFWKREEGAGKGRWIEPTEADYAARERW
jgi:molybdopterin synthase catalytic subunit